MERLKRRTELEQKTEQWVPAKIHTRWGAARRGKLQGEWVLVRLNDWMAGSTQHLSALASISQHGVELLRNETHVDRREEMWAPSTGQPGQYFIKNYLDYTCRRAQEVRCCLSQWWPGGLGFSRFVHGDR